MHDKNISKHWIGISHQAWIKKFVAIVFCVHFCLLIYICVCLYVCALVWIPEIDDWYVHGRPENGKGTRYEQIGSNEGRGE